MPKDYYQILGVSEGASREAITSAYRDAVLDHHPDNDDRPHAAERFKHLKNGYETLTSPSKRETYDSMEHNDYVSEHGGYTLDEFSQYIATGSTNSGSSNKDLVRVDRQRIKQSRGQWKEAQQKTGQVDKVPETTFREWLVRGRTYESEGTRSYGLRFLLFAAVFFVLTSAFESLILSVASVLGARVLYLILFERLREQYIKIELSPGSDAGALIYALIPGMIGIMASVAGGILYASGDSTSGGLLALPGATILVLSGLIMVMAIGWGVADDAYNLHLDVNPIFWNAAVQLPFITAITIWLTFPIIGTLVGTLPHLVGAIYIWGYHPELLSELKYRIDSLGSKAIGG